MIKSPIALGTRRPDARVWGCQGGEHVLTDFIRELPITANAAQGCRIDGIEVAPHQFGECLL
jgi:hypothetical protein